MASINFNAADVDPNPGFEPVPEGKYVASIIESTLKPTNIRLPMMALSKPPPALPGAGVFCVKSFQSSAAKPFLNSTARIHSSTARPSTMASIDSVSPTALRHLRRRYRP